MARSHWRQFIAGEKCHRATIRRPARRHFVASVDETLRCTTGDKLLQAIRDVYFDHFVFSRVIIVLDLDLQVLSKGHLVELTVLCRSLVA